MIGAPPRLVVIGASAGAIDAVSRILPALPADYPVPVVLVIHVPAGRSDLAALFAARCRLAVKDAEDKEPMLPGTVYLAPPDYHLLVESDLAVSLSVDDPVLYSRPSIDVTFESAAEACGPGAVGVVLTGANEDGAAGLAAIARAQGTVMVEDPVTAYATAMPEAALALCPRARVLSLDAIADHLVTLGEAS